MPAEPDQQERDAAYAQAGEAREELIAQLRADRDGLARVLAEVRSSHSYRIGRAVTSPARFVRSVIRKR